MNEVAGPRHGVLERILLAVDNGPGAERALRYVGHIIAGHSGIYVDLYHRLPALPPELREHGGSEYPARETDLGRELSSRIAEWVSGMEAEFRPTLERLTHELVSMGVPTDAVNFCIDKDVFPGESLADAMRRVARERGCHTLAVSRTHMPVVDGLDGFFRTGDVLVREGTGCAVWVIE